MKLVFDFAGSQDLVAQIGQGAPADVVATADTSTMADLAGSVGDPRTFVTNRCRSPSPPGTRPA